MDQKDTNSANEAFIIELYFHLLKRSPSERELSDWTSVADILPAAEVMRKFSDCQEYKLRNKIVPFFPVGHYHSPVVDPRTVGDYVASRRNPGLTGFHGINIDVDEMKAFWDNNRSVMLDAAFPEAKRDDRRFCFKGAPFPYGDALSLHAIIGRFRPRRIVEIGSGFSTACMLDSAEIHGINDLQITCIEPYPDRLRNLLRSDDGLKVKLLGRAVQEIPVRDIVDDLMPNDILFINSTHVLKTGSDVHYEIFDVIPAVRPGVIIHIHDCGYPFEYPPQWIEQNYSWNEVYAIRAFLMYNKSFKILFWGSLFKSLFPDKVEQEGGNFGKNSGTSLWLMRLP